MNSAKRKSKPQAAPQGAGIPSPVSVPNTAYGSNNEKFYETCTCCDHLVDLDKTYYDAEFDQPLCEYCAVVIADIQKEVMLEWAREQARKSNAT